MKTTKKTPAVDIQNPEPAIAGATCFPPRRTLDEITNSVLAQARKDKSGNANTLSDFARAIKLIVHSYQNQSFGFNEVVKLTGQIGDSAELIPLFHLWVDEMKANNRIKIINVVGFPVYSFC